VSVTIRRFRILDRYIVREILPPTGLGLLVFTFVILLQRLTALAALLISRSADLATTCSLLLHALPSIFALTVPMAFLLGVLVAFGRLASESEIVAMRASGVSPLQMLRPVLLLGAVGAAVTLYATGFAQPRAVTATREAIYSLVVGRARAGIKPRVFTDDLIQGMAFYVGALDADTGQWRDVFISDRTTPTHPRIILARHGQLAIDEETKTAVLNLRDGATYSHQSLDPAGGLQESFGTATIPLPFDQVFPKIAVVRDEREKDLAELWVSLSSLTGPENAEARRRYEMQLHRRLAIPVACLVFGPLGLALSLGHRKEARSAAFGLSIAVICAYYILMRGGEQAVANGVLRPAVGMWIANVLLGSMAAALLVLKQREAAFDPLSASHYVAWLPPMPRLASRRPRPRPGAALEQAHPSGLGPGLLDRYVAGQFVGFALLVLAAFWAVFSLFDFMDLVDDMRQHHIASRVVIHYYSFLAPRILHLVAPLAALVATLATFGVMVRRNEIVAMLAGGISLFRAAAPVITAAAVLSLVLFGMGELVLPHTNRTAMRDLDQIKGRPPQSASAQYRRWIMGRDGRIYYYEYFSQGPLTKVRAAAPEAFLHGLSVFDVDPRSWRLRDHLEAAVARWNGADYEMERGWRRTFSPEPRFRSFGESRTRELEPPSYFQREARDAESLSFLELREHIAFMAERGADIAPLQVQLHRKIAYPMAALVMTLLGIRFAFTVGRRGTLYGVGLSIVIAIAYWICMTLFEAMGSHGLLPPFLAAWAPNVLFGAAGLYLMLTLET
jgi:LPS export ABC transporter permease LptG/LPS export ABC transporter permease LptF